MQAIINFFTGLADIISSVIDFVIDFFKDLVYVIGLLGTFVVSIPTYFTWLPGAAVALLVTTFSIVVIYMILNRK